MTMFVVDPLVKALTVTQIGSDIEAFQNLLESKAATENSVHQFLATHSYFFNGHIRLGGVSPLYSKLKLGSSYEVDFAYFDTSSFGPEWELVEIESPQRKLFTKSGDTSKDLSHAIRQVQDWNRWVKENLSTARSLMPLIDYPLAHIFLGRRHDLDESTRNSLRQLNNTFRQTTAIHTFDNLIDGARSVINLVEKTNSGDWSLPMNSLSHSDLAKGLPKVATQFFANWADEEKRKTWQKEMLNERGFFAQENRND